MSATPVEFVKRLADGNTERCGNEVTLTGVVIGAGLTDAELRAAPVGVEITDGTSTATVRNLTANDALNVAIVDAAGNQVTSFGSGTVGIDQVTAGANHVEVTTLPAITGTVTIQDGGNTITVDGAVTAAITAAALPLPSGAATAANQLADGHNVTIDNAAAGAAVNIQDGGNTITVDGTVAVTGAQNTEYAEDAAHVSGDKGIMSLGVRKDTAVALAADGDYQPPIFDSLGRQYVNAGVTPSTPTVYNLTLTNANTEYSQALPANCLNFEFACRTAFDCRYAFVTGKVATPTAPYMTLKAGAAYNAPDVNIAAVSVLYFASAQAGVVIEIIAWT